VNYKNTFFLAKRPGGNKPIVNVQTAARNVFDPLGLSVIPARQSHVAKIFGNAL
jgi:hypothetical protein